MTILYITQNGITDHIGQSQVAPYVLGLARKGFDMHVLSAEKGGREELVAHYARLFDEAGVKWTRVSYRNTPRFVGQALTQRRLEKAARKIVRDGSVELVHCRSHPAALIGNRLRRSFGTPYLFDFRDFYADGGLTKTRGVTKLIFRWVKHTEARLVRDAAAMVCLTGAARDVLTQFYLSDSSRSRLQFEIIPCCADFAHFDPATLDPAKVAQVRERTGISHEKEVLLYLGSIGPDYLLPDMMRLFGEYKKIRPGAQFLFVANNGEDEIRKTAAEIGLSPDDIVFVTAGRDDIPALISIAKMSVIFIRPDLSKAGCSPTKLAELFAMNVPVIANSGFGDIDEILSLEENGSFTVPDFRFDTLREAVHAVLDASAGQPDIRANSRRFDLPAGVDQYEKTYRHILES